MNKMGIITEPCGTPDKVLQRSDEEVFMITYQLNLIRTLSHILFALFV